MSEIVLNAEVREVTGKKNANRLRREGKIPGIFYAREEQEIPLTLNSKDILRLLSSETGLINLNIDNKKIKKSIIKEIHFDPVTNNPIHVDIMGVKLKEKINISVPIHITGDAYGVKEEGGLLTQSLHELEINCLPLELPERIEVDVTDLKVGDTIHVKDLKLGKFDILNDPEVVVVGITMPRAMKEEEKPVEPAIEEEEAEKEEITEEAKKES